MTDSGLIKEYTDIYERYLRDESSEEGIALDISFPESTEEAAYLIKKFASEGADYVVQGGLSGIRGEAVPHGSHIINTSKMTIFEGVFQDEDDKWVAKVQPGITLDDLKSNIARSARGKGLIWQPAPSEGSACIGGIVFSGAFGMNICGCGSVSDHIKEIEYVSKNGEIARLSEQESIREWLSRKSTEKIGSCITGLSLKLAKEAEIVWGTAFFFETEESACDFADRLTEINNNQSAVISAMEFIDEASIKIAEDSRGAILAMATVPSVPEGTKAVIYVEIEAADESDEEAVEDLMMTAAEAADECGADLDKAWAFMGAAETRKIYDFRHAVTEAVTQRMAALHVSDKEMHLIAFDVTDESTAFSDLLGKFRVQSEESGLNMPVCGSIGAKTLRVIMIPEDINQMHRGEEIRSFFM